jgi:hypothetical protein
MPRIGYSLARMVDTVDQPTAEPTRKTTAAIIGGSASTAFAVVFGWVMRTYTHTEIPAEVQVAIASIITVAASYLTKERA